MNLTLCQDIEKEFLTGSDSQRIQEAILQQEEGTIEIFVRKGRHQKTSPPPISLLGEYGDGGLRYSEYKDMVNTIVIALQKCERVIDFGHLFIEYKANTEGELEKLKFYFKDVIQHATNKKG